MCTVTFSPRKNGYALAMNRDEKLYRITGLPPRSCKINDRTVISPSEPGGGTWISLNDAGATLALINWYSVTIQVKSRSVSRGEVVNATGSVHTPGLAAQTLAHLPLNQINPFRLIGVFPATHEIIEWRWNQKMLVRKPHRWTLQQWISSGFDEPMAQRFRGRTFQIAQKQKSVGSLRWLRRLHGTHSPEAGPFSTCMHRSDAATVSYTEVVVSERDAAMRYHAGAPCQCPDHTFQQLKLVAA
jgi:hypothetical protein